jgi:4-hydroxysphinganine ceramide fatty acyl 2-hydroxylase
MTTVAFKDREHLKEYCTANPTKIILTYKHEVFDVTSFVKNHPGGGQVLESSKSKDITKLFHSQSSHPHSEGALNLLFQHKIGVIEEEISGETTHVYPKITPKTVEFNDFQLDITRGIAAQVIQLPLKSYIHMIHNPIYLPHTRLFDHPFFEYFSRNKWYSVPMTWIPVSIIMMILAMTYEFSDHIFLDKYIMYKSPDFSAVFVFLTFVFGILLWSLGEYLLHRYAFHFEKRIPQHPWFIMLHFVIHGVHHLIPLDTDRLVFPPVLGLATLIPVYSLITFIFPGNFGRVVSAGFGFGYMCYDVMHFHLHHSTPPSTHFKEMKRYHIKHHYVDGDKGYGITSKFWDRVFGTVLY